MNPEMDKWAESLLELVKQSSAAKDLQVGREEARTIGEQINGSGGFALMQEVAARVRELGRTRGQPFASGYVERWWNGIGRWMA